MLSSKNLKQGAKLEQSARSRRFVLVFVALMVVSLAVSLTMNISRRAETEAVAAGAAAGQKVLADASGTAARSGVLQSVEPLEIITAGGARKLEVELMRSPDEQARGLMFRQSMPDEHGMLFDFGIDRPVAMWMKNTYIPLDMVFIKADGMIHRIEERTEPLSERTINSGTPVRAVLEINAGTARKLGMKAGDTIIHSMFPAK